MDPYGHLAPWLHKEYMDDEGVEIRPTIAITKAHMHLPELEQSVRAGRLQVDGKIVVNEAGELAVTKFAVEPCWYLPGVAERFGIGTSIAWCVPLVWGFFFSFLFFLVPRISWPAVLARFPPIWYTCLFLTFF